MTAKEKAYLAGLEAEIQALRGLMVCLLQVGTINQPNILEEIEVRLVKGTLSVVEGMPMTTEAERRERAVTASAAERVRQHVDAARESIAFMRKLRAPH